MVESRHLEKPICLTSLEKNFSTKQKFFDKFKKSKTYYKAQKYFRTS